MSQSSVNHGSSSRGDQSMEDGLQARRNPSKSTRFNLTDMMRHEKNKRNRRKTTTSAFGNSTSMHALISHQENKPIQTSDSSIKVKITQIKFKNN